MQVVKNDYAGFSEAQQEGRMFTLAAIAGVPNFHESLLGTVYFREDDNAAEAFDEPQRELRNEFEKALLAFSTECFPEHTLNDSYEVLEAAADFRIQQERLGEGLAPGQMKFVLGVEELWATYEEKNVALAREIFGEHNVKTAEELVELEGVLRAFVYDRETAMMQGAAPAEDPANG